MAAFSDGFERADTASGLGSADTGQPWTDAAQSRIVSGRVRSTFNGAGASYPKVDTGAQVVRQAMTFRYGTANGGALALLNSHGADGETPEGAAWNTMEHQTVWEAGAQFNVYLGGIPGALLLNHTFNPVLAAATDHIIAVTYEPALGRAVIELPDNTVHLVASADIAAALGPLVSYEHFQGALSVAGDWEISAVGTTTVDDTAAARHNLITNPRALTDLTAIAGFVNAAVARQVGVAPFAGTYVRATTTAEAFSGPWWNGGAPDPGAVVMPSVWLRSVSGDLALNFVIARIVYSDASVTDATTAVTMTTDWQRYLLNPVKANPAKTPTNAQLFVLQESAAIRVFDVTGVQMEAGTRFRDFWDANLRAVPGRVTAAVGLGV